MDKASLQASVDSCPFHQFLKPVVLSVDADEGEVVLKLAFRPEFARSPDVAQLHGGVTAALIDIAGEYAVVAKLGRGVPTINLRVDYLRMAEATDLTARATVVKAGRSIGVVDIVVRDDSERIVALGRGDYSTAQ